LVTTTSHAPCVKSGRGKSQVIWVDDTTTTLVARISENPARLNFTVAPLKKYDPARFVICTVVPTLPTFGIMLVTTGAGTGRFPHEPSPEEAISWEMPPPVYTIWISEGTGQSVGIVQVSDCPTDQVLQSAASLSLTLKFWVRGCPLTRNCRSSLRNGSPPLWWISIVPELLEIMTLNAGIL